jgi:serine/threonine protein kinase
LIPAQGNDLAPWLASLCGGRGLEIVSPSHHRPDAFTVIEVTTRHDMDLWIVHRYSLGAAALCRFEDLVPVMARLSHPHLLAIYDGGVHEGRPYLLVQRLEGRTLKEHIGYQPLEIGEAVGLAISLARAVHHVHEVGLIELDVFTNNILIADDKTPMIDLRRTIERRVLKEEGHWIHGGIAGCEAPEVLRGDKASRETDVYALGAILYEMLTGRAALTRGAVGMQAVRNILELDAERPRSFNKSVDRALESICLRCLAKHPTGRYGSAALLAGEMERWRSGVEQTSFIGRLWRGFSARAWR